MSATEGLLQVSISILKQVNGGKIQQIKSFYENLTEHQRGPSSGMACQSTQGQSQLTNGMHLTITDALVETRLLVGGDFGPEGARANGRAGNKNIQE